MTYNQTAVDKHLALIANLKDEAKQLGIVGPWLDEPDRLEFKYAGFDCLMQRNGFLAWCGYVGLPDSHPLYGKSYDEIPNELPCHGGITYSESCNETICHPSDDDTKPLWWLGFDCSHGGDWYLLTMQIQQSGIYRDQTYVKRIVERMAGCLLVLSLI